MNELRIGSIDTSIRCEEWENDLDARTLEQNEKTYGHAI